METVSGTEDMMDSGTASESPAEQKQNCTLVTVGADSLSHITAATGYQQEHSFDTVCCQAATQGSNMISNGSHSSVTNSEPKTADFSAGSSTDSYITQQSTVTEHCCEPVSHPQEIREFTDTQSAFVSEGNDDTISMEVEQVLQQEAERGLHQETEQILHQEAERGLHQEAEQILHQEAERGLHQEGERLHQETEQVLHQKGELGLNQDAERSKVHDDATAAVISETKPKFDSIAFIGPTMPSSHHLQSHGVCADACEDGTDDVIMEHPCQPQTSDVSSADDFRYNLTLGSVPRLAASTSWEFQQVDENFLRGCKWSPDGSCVLTNSNDNCLRIFNSCNETDTSQLTENKQLTASVRMKECSLVYDFAWHPNMNLSQSENCRVACTCSGIPIHLWDTTTGQIVANYRAYDQFVRDMF